MCVWGGGGERKIIHYSRDSHCIEPNFFHYFCLIICCTYDIYSSIHMVLITCILKLITICNTKLPFSYYSGVLINMISSRISSSSLPIILSPTHVVGFKIFGDLSVCPQPRL